MQGVNTVVLPNFLEILWNRTVSAEFSQNFHARKLGKTTVFYEFMSKR